MKIVVSSKYFAKILSRLDIDKNNVTDVCSSSIKTEIVLSSGDKHIAVNCDPSEETFFINQSSVRYDWLRDHLTKLPEMPIVLEFSANSLTMQINY